MTWMDRWGTRMRISKAARHVPAGARVLDVGCADGTLFRTLAGRISGGVGIDPHAPEVADDERFRFVRGAFPAGLDGSDEFDAIVALAVLEHVPREEQQTMAATCYRLLRPGGVVILTIPSALVDPIVDVFIKLRVSEGIAFEEHYGFKAEETRPLFEGAGFRLSLRRRFQLGLNNLFVFIKPVAERTDPVHG